MQKNVYITMKWLDSRPGDSFNAANQGNDTYTYGPQCPNKTTGKKAPRGI